MRALVTGGAGFIGSHLVDRLLAEGHQVDVLDDLSSGSLANLADARAGRTKRLTIHQVDVRDPGVAELVERHPPEVVFHLASRAPAAAGDAEGLVEDAAVTLVGGLRVVEGARRAGARKVVLASSAAIYRPPVAAELPVREGHPQQPVDPSGVAKKALTDYLWSYRERDELEFTALALAEVYGPRQHAGLVADLAAHLRSGEAPPFAPGATRDLVFVDDVVDAFVRAAERGSGLVVNVASGVETPVQELLGLVAAQLGVEVPRAAGRRRRTGEDRLALDRGRARIHLGWEPWTTLEDGLGQTLGAP